LELSTWLASLNIKEYEISKLIEYGVTQIRDIRDLDEEDWEKINTTGFIKKKILKNLPEENLKLSDNFKDFLINIIELEENVAEAIIGFGIQNKEDLSELDDDDLKKIGVDKSLVRKQILSKISEQTKDS